jgi:hypothetical protein
MDLGSVPPPRDRGQTFSQSKINAADRECEFIPIHFHRINVGEIKYAADHKSLPEKP